MEAATHDLDGGRGRQDGGLAASRGDFRGSQADAEAGRAMPSSSGMATDSRPSISPSPRARTSARDRESSSIGVTEPSSRPPVTEREEEEEKKVCWMGNGAEPSPDQPDVPSPRRPEQQLQQQQRQTQQWPLSWPQSSTSRPSPRSSEMREDEASRGDSRRFTGVWTSNGVADQLRHFHKDVKHDHAKLTAYILASTPAPDHRVHHGRDRFAGVTLKPVPEEKGRTVRVKFKQHVRGRRDQKEEHYTVVCTRTDKDRVPRYRFHHVGIKKNVLTPNTMLTFVPHLRDLEVSEEIKYNLWLKELEDIDLKSGFKPMSREEKRAITHCLERAATLSLYLDAWLERLAIPGCNKSALISYMASREPDDAMTPRKKTDILRSQREHDGKPDRDVDASVHLFTAAFRQVFWDAQPPGKRTDLRKVLLLDETVDSIMESKSVVAARDGTLASQNVDEDELAEANLATYCILGCLICFSHSCDHGEYDNKNLKRTFSISSCSRLSDALKRRRRQRQQQQQAVNGRIPPLAAAPPCHRQCYRRSTAYLRNDAFTRPWTEDEEVVLRSLYTTAYHSSYTGDPICLAARFLDRSCSEVFVKFQTRPIVLPPCAPGTPGGGKDLDAKAAATAAAKDLPWYDRRKKMLVGDWQEHTVSHEHQRRETLEPCSHEGPCRPRACPCVDAGQLCEKFCGCSARTCPYKFTGCACHSHGKTCLPKQRDSRPCLCIQLNRECDPELCGSCDALERADPENADDARLHATGCQNCALQRGVGKAVVLGKSQLDGVGYGLFTAEDIAQDDFIIEYVGELISHDEGVRRESRRGDVFDDESTVSYVFTLLENEGIWVDAAIYGNLSRYINHASEHDKRGCNITPRILYVNGEYRIKFTAMRDIQAGEELFFNYGENFPNLTKKLLDHKKVVGSRVGEHANGVKAKPPAAAAAAVARKAPKPEKKKTKDTTTTTMKKGTTGERRIRLKRDVGVIVDYEVRATTSPDEVPSTDTRKRKRHQHDDDFGAAEYRPPHAEEPTPPPAANKPDQGSARPAAHHHHHQHPVSRLRTRSLVGSPQQTQPPAEKTVKRCAEQPKKTKGKRGGTRPGSGRPRKHPRPAPKPSTLATDEPTGPPPRPAPTPASAPAAETTVVATVAAPAVTGTISVEIAETPPSARMCQGERASTSVELLKEKTPAIIDDSDVPMSSMGPDTVEEAGPSRPLASDLEMTQADEQQRDREGTGEKPVAVDDDDDDQDVVVRKRDDRSARNRRRPAKFRYDEIWN